MKKLSILVAAIALTGCQHLTIPTPLGPAEVRSFGQRTKITQLEWGTNGVLNVKGYNNDQVDALGIVAEGVARGVVQGVQK